MVVIFGEGVGWMAGVVANFDQLAVWSSGMILAQGVRGPGFNSQNSPCVLQCAQISYRMKTGLLTIKPSCG